MTGGLRIAIFGSSLVSSYRNGACTYYRGIVRALHERGHHVTFHEPDLHDRQRHRDLDDPPWARVLVYAAYRGAMMRSVAAAAGADAIITASGVGVFDDLLAQAVIDLPGDSVRIFWDVDAPTTLGGIEAGRSEVLRSLVPEFDMVLTYGGGRPVIDRYEALGAERCIAVYNALDPTTHHEVAPCDAFAADLAFLGNRLPDREARLEEFLFGAARRLPDRSFLLGGSGWEASTPAPNVRYAGHIRTDQHNAWNSTPLAVLNVTREGMAAGGHSPAPRIFEAAGAGACLITDAWEGIDAFLAPGREVLVARDGAHVAQLLLELDRDRAREIGAAARARVLAEHTYARRAELVERLMNEALDARRGLRGRRRQSPPHRLGTVQRLQERPQGPTRVPERRAADRAA